MPGFGEYTCDPATRGDVTGDWLVEASLGYIEHAPVTTKESISFKVKTTSSLKPGTWIKMGFSVESGISFLKN